MTPCRVSAPAGEDLSKQSLERLVALPLRYDPRSLLWWQDGRPDAWWRVGREHSSIAPHPHGFSELRGQLQFAVRPRAQHLTHTATMKGGKLPLRISNACSHC
jgi:hypothetical protein